MKYDDDIPKMNNNKNKRNYDNAKSVCLTRKRFKMNCCDCQFYQKTLCYDNWKVKKQVPLFELSATEIVDTLAATSEII